MNTPINKLRVRLSRFLFACRNTIFVFALIGFAICVPLAFAQPDPSIFDQRRYVPQETPRPEVDRTPPRKPIPKAVLIAGAAVLLLVSGILLVKSVRAWRSSNLFDRQYRFPAPGPAALRFGGNRCGGQLATLTFRSAEVKTPEKSKRENA